MVRRGDIAWADFGAARDSEADKRRPAIVVSGDGANEAVERAGGGVVVLVPLTSSIDRVYRFQVLVPAARTGLPRTSKAQAEQIRALSIRRIGATIGHVPPDLMAEIDDAIRLHLDL